MRRNPAHKHGFALFSVAQAVLMGVVFFAAPAFAQEAPEGYKISCHFRGEFVQRDGTGRETSRNKKSGSASIYMSGKTATLTSRSPRVTGEKMEAYRSEYIFEDGSESYDGSTETNVHVTFDLDSMSIAVEEMKYQHWKGGGGQRLYGKWANEWEAEGNCSKDDSGE